MNVLNETEVGMVSGGEILVSPGQIGLAIGDNTLIVVTGTIEAGAAMSTFGAGLFAFSVGWNIGSAIESYTGIGSRLGGWAYDWFNNC